MGRRRHSADAAPRYAFTRLERPASAARSPSLGQRPRKTARVMTVRSSHQRQQHRERQHERPGRKRARPARANDEERQDHHLPSVDTHRALTEPAETIENARRHRARQAPERRGSGQTDREAIGRAIPPAREQQREGNQPRDSGSDVPSSQRFTVRRGQVAGDEERIEPAEPREQVPSGSGSSGRSPIAAATTR